jgi:hypothetical protein
LLSGRRLRLPGWRFIWLPGRWLLFLGRKYDPAEKETSSRLSLSTMSKNDVKFIPPDIAGLLLKTL